MWHLRVVSEPKELHCSVPRILELPPTAQESGGAFAEWLGAAGGYVGRSGAEQQEPPGLGRLWEPQPSVPAASRDSKKGPPADLPPL